MKIYEVECRSVITIAAQDMEKAALHGAAVIKDNPHLIYVKGVHERKCESSGEALRTLINRELTVALAPAMLFVENIAHCPNGKDDHQSLNFSSGSLLRS